MDPDHLQELFSEFGPIQVRRMFGGAGLFVDGLMFALVAGGQIYLKAEPETVPRFEREGCRPFEYGTKDGKRVLTSYWRMPDRLYDDTEDLAAWARLSLTTARNKAAAKPKGRAAATRKKRKS